MQDQWSHHGLATEPLTEERVDNRPVLWCEVVRVVAGHPLPAGLHLQTHPRRHGGHAPPGRKHVSVCRACTMLLSPCALSLCAVSWCAVHVNRCSLSLSLHALPRKVPVRGAPSALR